jgi:hypothetical protein
MVTHVKKTASDRKLGNTAQWHASSDSNVGECVAAIGNNEVELEDGEEEIMDDSTFIETGGGDNLLIPEVDLFSFITKNFVCKQCHASCWARHFETAKIGCATNIFWKCGNNECQGSAKILAKQATKDTSGQYKKRYPELPSFLGDYDINRQVVLACQQSGGGAGMAATFGGIMSLTRRSIWQNSFSALEQLLGTYQIQLGQEIVEQNLRDEISMSPMNADLRRYMITLMMDGGWDQRASGKAYNSNSGRVVSVGGADQQGLFFSLLF